jgi:hypothetical protein
MFFDRRNKQRRAGNDRRENNERRIAERRRWCYGVLFRTRLPMTAIEEWLDECAEGRWSATLEDLDPKRKQKTLKLSFELESDKMMLVANFSRNMGDQ